MVTVTLEFDSREDASEFLDMERYKYAVMDMYRDLRSDNKHKDNPEYGNFYDKFWEHCKEYQIDPVGA